MKELTIKLNQIEDSYYGFVVAVLTYVKKKQTRLDTVKMFMEEHPHATSSDVLEFISNQEDFYEDASIPCE